MNNNLRFIVTYHPWRAAAKHTGIIKSTILRTSSLSAGAHIWPNALFIIWSRIKQCQWNLGNL